MAKRHQEQEESAWPDADRGDGIPKDDPAPKDVVVPTDVQLVDLDGFRREDMSVPSDEVSADSKYVVHDGRRFEYRRDENGRPVFMHTGT